MRQGRPLQTTFDLTAAVTAVAPRNSARHPATRVFQALRIAVNDELGVLVRGIEGISQRLAPGARFAIITFHSLEDRIVKHFFRDRSVEWIDRPEWPEPKKTQTDFSVSSRRVRWMRRQRKLNPTQERAAPSCVSSNDYDHDSDILHAGPPAQFQRTSHHPDREVGDLCALHLPERTHFRLLKNQQHAIGDQTRRVEKQIAQVRAQNEVLLARVSVLSSRAALQRKLDGGGDRAARNPG